MSCVGGGYTVYEQLSELKALELLRPVPLLHVNYIAVRQ